MPVTVDELRRMFPSAPGGTFTVAKATFNTPELYLMVDAEDEFALIAEQIDAALLTISGHVDTIAGQVAVALEFVTTGQQVVGMVARLPARVPVVDLAELFGLDLSWAPEAFLPELSEVSLRYELGLGDVVLTAQTQWLRLVFASAPGGTGRVGLVGVRDSEAYLNDLPFAGELVLERTGAEGLELIAVHRAEVSAVQAGTVNARLAEAVGDLAGWPTLPDRALTPGLWIGATCVLPGRDPQLWVVPVRKPGTEVPQLPEWLDLPDLELGAIKLPRIGLHWAWGVGAPDVVEILLDARFELGPIALSTPDLRLEFTLPKVGAITVKPYFPAVALHVLDRELRFDIPDPQLPNPPTGVPGLPGPGELTGLWQDVAGLRLQDLAAAFGVRVPEVPEVFLPTLTSLGFRYDIELRDFELVVKIGRVRVVFAALRMPNGFGFAVLVGLPELSVSLGDLPFVGSLIPQAPRYRLDGIELIGIGSVELPKPQVERLNAWLAELAVAWDEWWPALPDLPAVPGISFGLSWTVPQLPPLVWSVPLELAAPEIPDVAWIELDLELGPLRLRRLGLSWLGGLGGDVRNVLRVLLDARLDLGVLAIEVPELSFDFELSKLKFTPRVPQVALEIGDMTVPFAVPRPQLPDVPDYELPPAAWPKELTAALIGQARISALKLAAALGLDLSAVPPALVPELPDLALGFDFAANRLLIGSVSGQRGWLAAAAKVGQSWQLAALVRAAVSARASDLPLVGESITIDRDVAVTGVGFGAASANWSATEAAKINGALDLIGEFLDADKLPRFLPGGLSKGVTAWADLIVDGEPFDPLVLELQGGTLTARAELEARPGRPEQASPEPGDSLSAEAGSRAALAPRSGSASGKDVGLVLGPVRILRVGLGYARGVLFLAIDAILTVGPVQLSLRGLGFGFDGEFEVSPVLKGAGVVLDKPPVKVSGLLERRSDAEYSELLRGAVSIEAGFVAVEAFGMYARSRAGWSSMFLFGELGATGGRGLFGPPPFRVLSLCLGFGVNSTVRAPSVAQISEFPLVNKLGSGVSPGDALEALQSWITPKEGQYWGAGGLEFSSFQFISTRALLLVEGGQEWQVMLLGRTTLDFPRNKSSKRPLARVVVDIAIGYSQRAQVFSMDAVVAPGSYVLDPAAELTGGLAVRIWGQDASVGRGFVFTLGGYHKDFDRPAYYPRVPRLGWRWARGDVSIRGEVYAAITDAAFMAGGRLEVRYDKGHGIRLEAWLTARVDALVQWKPFYFSVSMGISVGVAATVKVLFVRVRVSLEVGVSLDLWGPPIGGTARVKVWFISFTIGIGSSKESAPLPGWDEFKVQLPGPLAIVPERGILADADPAELAARAAANAPLLVTIDGFAFSTTSSVPASKLMLNGSQFKPGASVNIRPMGKFGATSEHKVTIKKGSTTFNPAAENWTVSEVVQDLPAALWGAKLADSTDALKDGLVPNCLTGIRFEVPPPQKTGELGPASAEALGTEELQPTKIPLRSAAAAGPEPAVDADSVTTIANAIAASATTTKRNAAYAGLTALGVEPGSNDPLSGFADRARSWFTDAPLTTEAAT